MAEDLGDKSQDPTPHRRQQMRERGHVARSQDLGSAGLLLGGLGVLMFTGGALLDYLAGFLGSYLSGEAWMSWVHSPDATGHDLVVHQFHTLMPGLAKSLLPVLGFVLLFSIGLNIVQTGFLFLPHRLVPDFARVDPLAGLRRIFSAASAGRLAFGLLKIVAILAVAGAGLWSRRDEIVGLSAFDLPQIAAFAWDMCLWTCLKIGASLLVLAMADYGYQRWKFERDARMTPQEVREELRNAQGDPRIGARRRALQQQMARPGLAQAVSKADVVVTAPGELAVALQYDARSMRAPIVVAKGAGIMAERIRGLAAERHVPTIENQPLARSLDKEVAVDRPIPDRIYAEVALVLAQAYRANTPSAPAV